MEEEIHNRPSYRKWRSNACKTERELFCMSRACEFLNIDGYAYQEHEQNSDIDITLVKDSKSYHFQIAEIAPRSREALALRERLFKGGVAIGGTSQIVIEISDIQAEITNAIQKIITSKSNMNYSREGQINLLIYVNGPQDIIIDSELDIDLGALRHACADIKFLTVILLTEDRILWVKGDSLIATD